MREEPGSGLLQGRVPRRRPLDRRPISREVFWRLDDETEGEQQRQLGKELSLLTAAGHVITSFHFGQHSEGRRSKNSQFGLTSAQPDIGRLVYAQESENGTIMELFMNAYQGML